jgi:quercetin dioxygenase-like cupin family protein
MFAQLSDFPGGWIVGDFLPAIMHSTETEVAVKVFARGDSEPRHFQKTVTEITVIVSGSCMFAGKNLTAGQIVVLEPGEVSDFLALTDCTIVCVKSPSKPDDKVVVDD